MAQVSFIWTGVNSSDSAIKLLTADNEPDVCRDGFRGTTPGPETLAQQDNFGGAESDQQGSGHRYCQKSLQR